MSYDKQVWQDGNAADYPLSDARMLHIEDGIYTAHLRPTARAYNSAAQLVPSGVDTALSFDSESFDSNGLHDTTANKTRLVATEAGKYVVSAHVAFAASATGVRRVRLVRTRIADATTSILASDARNAVGGALTTDFSVSTAAFSMSAGDYVEVKVYQDTGSNLNVLGGDTGRYCAEAAITLCSALTDETVGTGGGTGGGSTVSLPTAPGQNYSIPAGAVSCATAAAFKTEFAKTTAEDIVLEDGLSVTGTTYLTAGAAHRVYARSVGKPVLKVGVESGSTNGLAFYGVAFNVNSASKGLNGACLHLWGTASNAIVQDCSFDGTGVMSYGVLAFACQGMKLVRSSAQAMTDVGFRLSPSPVATTRADNTASTVTIDTVQDVSASSCYRRVADAGAPIARGSSNGTGEAGVVIGAKVTNGVHRVYVTNAGWSGVLVLNAAKSMTISDVTVDKVTGTVPPGSAGAGSNTGTGVYFEAFADGITLTNFNLAGDLMVGVACEWNHGTAGQAAAKNLVVQNGTIDTNHSGATGRVGVWLDQGTDHPTVTGVKFLHCDDACIRDRSNPASVDASTFPTAGNGLSTLTQSGNDFGALVGVKYG